MTLPVLTNGSHIQCFRKNIIKNKLPCVIDLSYTKLTTNEFERNF